MINNLLINFLVEFLGIVIVVLFTGIFIWLAQHSQSFNWLKNLRKEAAFAQISFSERLGKLSENLTSASEDFDKVLAEMNQVANDRKLALTTLEAQVAELSKREGEMKKKVNELEKISIPALDYFIQASEKSENRSAKRDYFLFIAGVVVSAIVSIILRLAFGV